METPKVVTEMHIPINLKLSDFISLLTFMLETHGDGDVGARRTDEIGCGLDRIVYYDNGYYDIQDAEVTQAMPA